jgi:hypothetical protein
MPRSSVASAPSTFPRRNGAAWAAGLAFVLSMIAWLGLYGPYFDPRQPAVGHDFLITSNSIFDNALFFWKNGPFALPWFTPGFCGGQPSLADPQSMYLSPMQWMGFFMPPLEAAGLYSWLCAAIAFWGFWLLARRGLGLSPWVAAVAGVLGALNGFLPHRLATGEMGFGAYCLFGFIATAALAPRRAPPAGSSALARAASFLRPALWLGFFGALFILWGGLGLAPILALSVVALGALSRALGRPAPALAELAGRCAAGLAAFVALAGFQLFASLAVLKHFPRHNPYWPGFESLPQALLAYWLDLVQGGQSQAEQFNLSLQGVKWAVLPMEWAENFGWAPWVAAAVCAVALLASRGRSASGDARRKTVSGASAQAPAAAEERGGEAPATLLWRDLSGGQKAQRLFFGALFTALLVLPGFLLWRHSGWTDAVKTLPFFSSSSWPFRWVLLVVAPVGLLLAWPLGAALERVERRFGSLLAVAGAVVLCALFWAFSSQEPRGFYIDRDFGYQGAAEMEAAWEKARANPAAFDVAVIGPTREVLRQNPALLNAERNNLVAHGQSAQLCYNPLYGYGAEDDPARKLDLGQSVLPADAGAAPNLINPACLAWPEANACKPGDRFRPDQREQARAFAAREPFAFEVSARQAFAERLSAASWIALAALALWAFARSLRDAVRKAPAWRAKLREAFLVDLGSAGAARGEALPRDAASAESGSSAKTSAQNPALGALLAARPPRPFWREALFLAALLAALLGALVAFLGVFGSSDNPLLWDDQTIFSTPAYSSSASLWDALRHGLSLNPRLYWRPVGLATLLLPVHWGWLLTSQQALREALWIATAALVAVAGALAFALRRKALPSRAGGASLFAGALGAGALASLLWSLAPANGEAAQWLSGRFDLLCASFLALWIVAAFAMAARGALLRPLACASFAVAFACSTLAFLSKDFAPGFFAAALPLALWLAKRDRDARLPAAPASAAAPSRSGSWLSLAPLAGLLVGGAAAAGLRALALGGGSMPVSFGLAWSLSRSAQSGARYLLELLDWPGVGLDRPIIYWMPDSVWPAWAGALFWLAAAAFLLWGLRRALRSPSPGPVLLWGAGAGALAHGAMLLLGGFSSQTLVSERYLCAPLVALALAVSPWVAERVGSLSPARAGGAASGKRTARLMALLGLGAFALFSLWQAKSIQLLFSDPVAFWEHAASLPGAPIDAKNNYLSELAGNNRSKEAIAYGETLLAGQAPSEALIRPATNLAMAYADANEPQKALDLEKRFADAGFSSIAMESNRASQLLVLGRCDEAIETLGHALSMTRTVDGPAASALRQAGRPRLLSMYAVCRPQEYPAQRLAFMLSQHMDERALDATGLPAFIRSTREIMEQAKKNGAPQLLAPNQASSQGGSGARP